MIELPDGEYPFHEHRYALAKMIWAPAPEALEALLRAQAKANGVDIIVGSPVELRCQMPDFAESIFFVYLEHRESAMLILQPKEYLKGQA